MWTIHVTDIEIEGNDEPQSYSFEINPCDYIRFRDIIYDALECDLPDWNVRTFRYEIECDE